MTTALHTHTKEELVDLLIVQQQLNESHRRQIESHQRELEITSSRAQKLEKRSHQYEEQVAYLKHQIAQYERMIYGAKRERFISERSESQLALTFEPDDAEVVRAIEAEVEQISYERKKPQKKKHVGRMELPKHLPVFETVIEPEEDTTGMVCIGREITEELELTPASMHVNRTIRLRYAAPEATDGTQRILIAAMPRRPIDKCIAGVNLLATITINKHVYHMPIYRQLQQFSMLGVDIPSSTVESWQHLIAELMRPLYAGLRSEVMQASYLQVDETGLAVQDPTKKGDTHKGFLWGYHAPVQNIVFFDYQKGRGQIHCRELLDTYKGYLQTDDYQVYHQHKARADVIGIACWAHTRRNFDKALDSDRDRASVALKLIQKLYDVEREARENNLTYEQRKVLRLEKSLPTLNVLSAWIVEQQKVVLPKSPLGKALAYAERLWDQLLEYLSDGRLEIDNNLMENAIRPIALGRKNWLFAGSHEAAQNIAMYRSLFAICILNDINPYNWLKYVLENINSTAPINYKNLLPHRIDKALLG